MGDSGGLRQLIGAAMLVAASLMGVSPLLGFSSVGEACRARDFGAGTCPNYLVPEIIAIVATGFATLVAGAFAVEVMIPTFQLSRSRTIFVLTVVLALVAAAVWLILSGVTTWNGTSGWSDGLSGSTPPVLPSASIGVGLLAMPAGAALWGMLTLIIHRIAART